MRSFGNTIETARDARSGDSPDSHTHEEWNMNTNTHTIACTNTLRTIDTTPAVTPEDLRVRIESLRDEIDEQQRDARNVEDAMASREYEIDDVEINSDNITVTGFNASISYDAHGRSQIDVDDICIDADCDVIERCTVTIDNISGDTVFIEQSTLVDWVEALNDINEQVKAMEQKRAPAWTTYEEAFAEIRDQLEISTFDRFAVEFEDAWFAFKRRIEQQQRANLIEAHSRDMELMHAQCAELRREVATTNAKIEPLMAYITQLQRDLAHAVRELNGVPHPQPIDEVDPEGASDRIEYLTPCDEHGNPLNA